MKQLKRKQLPLAVARALSAGVAVGLAAPLAYAQAQQPAAPAAQQQQLERVEITGSRIMRRETESESPVNVITAQEIKMTGATNSIEVVTQLPSVSVDQDSAQSNGATGTATVSLRGLAADRTLVLMNGRRMPAGDPGYFPTDLNFIPAPLIQRVEVLTGGASAVYGSDAVAGVVNFIMNDKFQGVQVDYTLSGYNHQQGSFVGDIVAGRAATNPAQFKVPGDIGFEGKVNDISVLMGSNFADGKGNATLFVGYHRQDPILQADYDYSSCAINSTSSPTAPYVCGGSSTSFPGRFFSNLSSASYTIADAQGNLRPFVSARDQYNFAPLNYYQRPGERWSAAAFAHYDVHPQVRVYGELGFMDDTTNAQIAPSGLFVTPVKLSNTNPLLSQDFISKIGVDADPTDVIIGRRNVEGGGRVDNIQHTDYRAVLGVKGDFLNNAWEYNAWMQYGKNVFNSNYQNDFSSTRIQRALTVVADPTTGKPVCASVLDGSDPNCVPYDIFRLGGVTPDQLNYLQTPGFQSGYTSQTVYGATVTSDLGTAYGWRTPWAKSGVGVAMGLEYRRDELDLKTDLAFSTGDLAGQGGPTIGLSGSTSVWEPYLEVRVPVIENMDFARSLNFTGSYRYSDYSNSAGKGFTTNTYGLGFDWSPIREGKLRGSYQKAVRAPNIIDLFTAQGTNLFDMDADPCGPSKTATAEQCARTGLAASLYGADILDSPAGQYNYLQGGNASLDPETAKTWTFGLVLQPTANLAATIDYWSIKVDDVIDNIQPVLKLQQCLESGTYCNDIQRDAFGTLWLSGAGGQVTALQQNLGSLKTDGIDIGLNWRQPITDWGSLGVMFQGTWVQSFETQPLPNGGSYDCAGYYGTTCGQPNPEWRHRLALSWNAPWNVLATFAWRYIGDVKVDTSSSNPLLTGAPNPPDLEIGAQSYFDLALQWTINKNWTIRGGINNLFDKDPPVVTQTIAGPSVNGNGNTFPGVYDYLGRNLFLNITAKF
jgi:outer membrane receptor protein involved in Fe transport